MNKKRLWKIEELWNKYYIPTIYSESNNMVSVLKSYENGISRYNSNFTRVNKFEFSESKENIHNDDYGDYKGLKKSQLRFLNNKPIYLFDNHNKIMYPFVEIYEYTKKPLSIVHIDAHADDARFEGKKLESLALKDVKNYIDETRISDFFDALCETKIINTVYPIIHSDSFEFFVVPEEPYVLSLDIDIFGPEGDFCELEDKVRTIALAWNKADVVCIAMSPGFINQEYAQEIIKIFVT
jgi:hypothetical protein